MKIRLVGAEFHANKHDKANTRFSQFCERDQQEAQKWSVCPFHR